jgi:hypothetical protein
VYRVYRAGAEGLSYVTIIQTILFPLSCTLPTRFCIFSDISAHVCHFEQYCFGFAQGRSDIEDMKGVKHMVDMALCVYEIFSDISPLVDIRL